MTKYIYDRNRCYLGSTERADATRNVTEITPPETGDGEVAVFSGDNWIVLEDNRRKQMFNVLTAEEQMVTQPGPIPDGWTFNESEVDTDAIKEKKIKEEKEKAEKIIADAYPIEYQVKVALGVIEDAEMIASMKAIEAEKNSKIEDINKTGKEK